jgi:hypothetical protein
VFCHFHKLSHRQNVNAFVMFNGVWGNIKFQMSLVWGFFSKNLYILWFLIFMFLYSLFALCLCTLNFSNTYVATFNYLDLSIVPFGDLNLLAFNNLDLSIAPFNGLTLQGDSSIFSFEFVLSFLFCHAFLLCCYWDHCCFVKTFLVCKIQASMHLKFTNYNFK